MPHTALSVIATSASFDHFKTVLDLSHDAMFLIDRANIAFVEVNAAACRLLGYSREEMLATAPMRLTGRSRDFHETVYDRLISGAIPPDVAECTLTRKDGAPLTAEIHRRAQWCDGGWIIVAQARDVTETRRMQKMVAQANEDMARLAIELQVAREEERRNLGARLHGDLGQLLAALRINLSLLQQQFPDLAYGPNGLGGMEKLTASAIASLRKISAELRPKDLAEGNLYLALRSLAQEMAECHAVQCELHADEIDLLLDDSRSTMVFRMVQEALENVLMPAQPKQVVIEFRRQESDMLLSLRSDAPGIAQAEVRHPSYRLAALRERVRRLNGSLEISAVAEPDNRIDIVFPVSE